MKLTKLALTIALTFIVQHAFAQDETTTTTNPDGSTTTRTVEDRDENKGGLFVEPAIKYERLEGDINLPGLGKTSVDADGAGVGARLGVHVFDSMFLAFEGNYSQLNMTEKSTDYSASGNAYSYGPVVGFQTPWAGIRLWGTYLAGGQFDPGSNRAIDLKFKDLRGYRVGLGFRVAKVGISVEYQDSKYDKTELQDAGPISGTSDGVELKQTGWVAQLNFPMAL